MLQRSRSRSHERRARSNASNRTKSLQSNRTKSQESKRTKSQESNRTKSQESKRTLTRPRSRTKSPQRSSGSAVKLKSFEETKRVRRSAIPFVSGDDSSGSYYSSSDESDQASQGKEDHDRSYVLFVHCKASAAFSQYLKKAKPHDTSDKDLSQLNEWRSKLARFSADREQLAQRLTDDFKDIEKEIDIIMRRISVLRKREKFLVELKEKAENGRRAKKVRQQISELIKAGCFTRKDLEKFVASEKSK